jgi:hypothetical protein
MLKRSAALVPASKAVNQLLPVLLDLNAGEAQLVRATFLRRPSERNKSPMVADVELADGRVVLAHVPSMDLGGKCVAGKILSAVTMLLLYSPYTITMLTLCYRCAANTL